MQKIASSRNTKRITRRDFIKTASVGAVALLAACQTRQLPISTPTPEAAGLVSDRPVVSIVKIKRGKIETAVEAAIDLLGGIKT
jgi:hypothetical protein